MTLSITVQKQGNKRSNKAENKTLIIFPSILRENEDGPPHPSGTPKSSGRKWSLCVVAGPFDGRDDYSRRSVHDPWMGVLGKYDAHRGDPPALAVDSPLPLFPYPSFPNMNMISHPATYEMIYQLSTGNPGVLWCWNIITSFPPRLTLILSPWLSTINITMVDLIAA